MPPLSSLSRVSIIGSSCAGKTTLARSLSAALGIPHIELDALHWGPNWTPCETEEFRARVRAAVAAPAWVADGNYSKTRDIVWARATTVIWLNYPFPLVFGRAVTRTLRRIITRETLFAGNRETLAITDPDWIPWWVLRTFRRRRRAYPQLLRQPQFAHLRVLELTRPSQAQHLLEACAS